MCFIVCLQTTAQCHWCGNIHLQRISGEDEVFRMKLSISSPDSQVEVSPLENAIEVIENKNLQLRTLITQCQSRQMQNINPLTMCLNGVIDAAVNGGLARYQEVWMDGGRMRLEGFRDPGRSEAMTYGLSNDV